ncbi:MAG: chitobiase/beta-hexosaminidase C-terminal domain-containing protein [Clostridia bacterium]|nr:chitobiase/beta-hexosaminidase C-terminal domain-containing protein [Clostridia bacterium]
MLCPGCGYYTDREDTVCPKCGEILNASAGGPTGGAEAIRQGRRARQAIHDAAEKQSSEAKRRRRSGASHATVEMPVIRDEQEDYIPAFTVSERDVIDDEEDGDTVFERRRRSVYDEDAALEEQAKAYIEWIEKGGNPHLKMVNWMKISVVIVILLILVVAGGWLFLKKTDEGQKLMARLGREATSSALWAVGEELMNTGDMEGAITNFLKAKEQDEEAGLIDPDGLLMLANAYEAAGRTDDAATLYEKIYTDTPSRTEAYVNHIRILRSSGKPGDLAKAGELMKTAYQMTGESSFETQRRDLLPAPPEVDLTAGYYEAKKYIAITSYQGYDVYWTFDENAELPSGGTLWTERVFLDEGIWNLRAVAVNGELVSDELKGTYKIIMPSPQTPRCNLAPGAYKTRQKVRLKPGIENENDDDIVIYYTVDGSVPDADCPIYTGEPVQLPSGHTVTIKAVAVNKYKKVSNMLEVSYKIEAKPYPLTAWELKETIGGLELNKTTMADFQSRYGEGTLVEMEQNGDFETECRKYEYSWGYAVMNMAKRNWVLVELYFKDGSTFKAPRGTSVGDPMDFVVGKYKDLGQLKSASGNRGLYALDSGSDGKIWKQEEKTGKQIVRYRIRNEGHYYVVDYHVDQNGTVTAVDWWYKP